MTREYVRGVQEMGVATVTKHFVFNSAPIRAFSVYVALAQC